MCLITEQKEPELTTEDLVVWKVCYENIKKQLIPLFYKQSDYFSYGINELKQTEMAQELRLMRAQHFDDKTRIALEKKYNDWHMSLELGELISIGQGFHFAFEKDRFNERRDYTDEGVFRFIVPAGSLIYKDCSGLGVSNQIIYSPEPK